MPTPEEKLDARLSRLLAQHSLQNVLESLRRIAFDQVELLTKEPSPGRHSLPLSKWRLAHTILVTADRALYAQHCGDVKKTPGRP